MLFVIPESPGGWKAWVPDVRAGEVGVARYSGQRSTGFLEEPLSALSKSRNGSERRGLGTRGHPACGLGAQRSDLAAAWSGHARVKSVNIRQADTYHRKWCPAGPGIIWAEAVE